MDWLSGSWILLAFGLGVLAFFAMGRGGCGMGHGGHDRKRRTSESDQHDHQETTIPPRPTSAVKSDSGGQVPSSSGHVHVTPTITAGALAGENAGRRKDSGQDGRQQHRHGC